MNNIILKTDRLLLRTWCNDDLIPMYQINQDPLVMEYFPSLCDWEDTKKFVTKINQHHQKNGFSLYAVELKKTGEFIGFVGLSIPEFEAHFTPCIEIGYRLSSQHWGKGYATEAAQTVLDYAFNELKLNKIVSFTSILNKKSIRVMEKIGLKKVKEGNFYHPCLPQDHKLSLHVLYTITKNEYKNRKNYYEK